MKKRITSILLVTAMIISMLPSFAFAVNETLTGEGTADNPYLISSEDDLIAFRDLLNSTVSSEAVAKLTDDIELSNEWTPFAPQSGYVTEAFKGVFDGDFHTISGLYINSTASNQGFFGVINGATIKNLNLEGDITSSNNYVGGIVGKIQQGAVENCTFKGTVATTKSGGYAGGIAGYAGNTATQTAAITSCANYADVTADTKGYAGGITGYAKYTTITNCYNTGSINGASRSAGIAGQLQNNCSASNCYNIGSAAGSATSADICDFLYSSSTLSNCFYITQAYGAGTGTAVDCSTIADENSLLILLGDAFTADEIGINDGYPILKWQETFAPTPKNPHIAITGGTSLNMRNDGTTPTTTLTVSYVDMDDTPVIEWSVKSENDVIALETPENADECNSVVIVRANKAGIATVVASAEGGYTAETTISVMPFITTVEIDRTPIAGEKVYAKVNILGGYEYDYENFPDLKIQWKYLTDEDYLGGNTGAASYKNIEAATSRELTIPSELAGDYLSFTLIYNGEEIIPSHPVRIYTDVTELEEEKKQEKLRDLRDIANSLGDFFTLTPVFGTDENVLDMMKSRLSDYENVDISIKSIEEIYGNAKIDNAGNISYFYIDPNTVPAVKMGRYNVTFTLTLDNAELDLDVPVIIYWDADKVKETMREEILSRVAEEDILGENISIDCVRENLVLPKVVDGKKWTQIKWTSSDNSVISVSSENQTTADTLFNPYVGIVKRGKEDRQVTLTAEFTFMLTNDVTGSEAPITLIKAFKVNVEAAESEEIIAIKNELNSKLDAGFEKAGLTDAVSGEILAADNYKYTALNDITFPTTRDFGVDGKYYPISIVSSNPDVIKAPDTNNAARVTVYRPAVGKPDGECTVTVTITDKSSDISVSRTFDIIVPALKQTEIIAEKNLMEKVKASYFEGIKGANEAANNISGNLVPFREVYEENGGLVWVRDINERVNHGIVPVPIEGWEKLEAWRLFRSSNPASISHENLLVTMQKNGKAVTITSALSSETLGKYGELYKSDPVTYADYAELADLYYQEVSADLVVRGTRTKFNVLPFAVEEKINVTFRLQDIDSTLITTQSYKNLDEGNTVFDIFKKALEENGYTFTNRGSYITSITTPDGVTIEEKQNGENSGWMYKVNGDIPEIYMGAYGLLNGDKIVVYFTQDYMEGYESNKNSGGSSSRKNNEDIIDKNTSDSTKEYLDKKPLLKPIVDGIANGAVDFLGLFINAVN